MPAAPNVISVPDTAPQTRLMLPNAPIDIVMSGHFAYSLLNSSEALMSVSTSCGELGMTAILTISAPARCMAHKRAMSASLGGV